MKIRVSVAGNSYEVDIQDLSTRPIIAEVNGQVVEIYPEQKNTNVSVPVVAASSSTSASSSPMTTVSPTRTATPIPVGGASVLVAPLPGTIISIDVKPGENVKKGSVILTLEAMKMKNAIRSEVDGVIADVHVNQGDLVKHGQVLVSFKG